MAATPCPSRSRPASTWRRRSARATGSGSASPTSTSLRFRRRAPRRRRSAAKSCSRERWIGRLAKPFRSSPTCNTSSIRAARRLHGTRWCSACASACDCSAAAAARPRAQAFARGRGAGVFLRRGGRSIAIARRADRSSLHAPSTRPMELPMRRTTLAVVLVFALALLGACQSAPPTRAPAASAAPIAVRLIAINDLHGYLEPNPYHAPGQPDRVASGVVALAGAVERLRAEQPASILVAAGDLIGASPLSSSLLHDQPTI